MQVNSGQGTMPINLVMRNTKICFSTVKTRQGKGMQKRKAKLVCSSKRALNPTQALVKRPDDSNKMYTFSALEMNLL